jgi:hypothetical protein
VRLHKSSLTFATVIAALAGVSALDTASASNRGFGGIPTYYYGGGFLYRAPQANQTPPGATSRPSGRDMRMAPPMGGRAMGRGRMNGRMRQR